MFLKSLHLKNFQKHEDLKLDFTPGVNILYGHSDAGKSCIRRAIGFLFFGDPRSDDTIRKEGTKITSVTGLLDNGTEVERVKSASINRYIVRVPSQKELVYDSIGADIPEEVQQVLQVKAVKLDQTSLNLNMAEQVSMPFLTDLPGSLRLKLFNKLTGNDLLDIVIGNFNKEIINVKRDLKAQKGVIAVNEPEVAKLDEQLKSKKITADFVVEKMKSFGDKYQRLQRIIALRDRRVKITSELDNTNFYLDQIKEIEPGHLECLQNQVKTVTVLVSLNERIKTLKGSLEGTTTLLTNIKTPELDTGKTKTAIRRLEKLQRELVALELNQDSLRAVQTELSILRVPTLDIAGNRSKLDRIQRLKKSEALLKENCRLIKEAFGEWNQIQKDGPTDEDYQALLKEAKICPLCKQDTSKCEVHL